MLKKIHIVSEAINVSFPKWKKLFRFNQVYSMIIKHQICWVFMWNVDTYRENRQIGGREKQIAMNLRRERSSISWEWKWHRLKMSDSEINTWVFLEMESVEPINCQSRFGWRRILQLIWHSSILLNNTMPCPTIKAIRLCGPEPCGTHCSTMKKNLFGLKNFCILKFSK